MRYLDNTTMTERSAAIIVDTGFSEESLKNAQKIIAVLDVRTGSVISGYPFLSWEHNEEVLKTFAGDPLNHGSFVLNALVAAAPHLPVILIRAYDDNGLIRTKFHNSKIVRPGWTEAYLTAVHICKNLGLSSVANLSFGGYTHAADGTGWESHCLSTVTGPGKPGHIVVAGAGTGTGANIHSSWRTGFGEATEINARQESTATYNLWCSAKPGSHQFNDWLFEVFLDGEKIAEEHGGNLIPNLWNHRKQVTLRVEGAGDVKIRTSRTSSTAHFDSSSSRNSDNANPGIGSFHCVKKPFLSLVREEVDPFRFDCWINQLECTATFLDHEDPMLVAEPAVFPHVMSVGLSCGTYDLDQKLGAIDLLIEGDGPISFRLPEITAEIADRLAEDPSLDVKSIRRQVRKLKATG